MPRRRRTATLQFNAIQLVGGLLPASLIEQIALQHAAQQKPSDYTLQKNQRLQVAVDQAWNRAKALWQEAQELRRRGEAMPWAAWFSKQLLEQVFDWANLGPCPPRQIAEAIFPITHQAFSGEVPLVFTSLGNDELDKGYKQFGQDSRRRSPHSCLQECLNADDSSNWGLLCNGTSLRLLHDNPALVKPAYVAVALDQIFDGGLFDEFAVVWLLLHASRFQRRDDGSCVLDGWKQEGQQSGERALNKLRDGVQAALEAVGQGVLQHPANGDLVAKLQNGELSTQTFFRQLLRLVYRLLFLCVAEDRNLLFAPEVPLELRQIYREGYSLSRLRDLAIRSGAHEQLHGDLWLVQKLVFEQLRNQEGSSLGLPALGGLFEEDRCPDLDTAQLSNAALLEAVRAIGWFYDEQSQSRTRINYQALNTEEFGSVYESLLELHPQIHGSGANLRFSLGGVAGSERKTSGSYYTPEDLVRLLILSALLPVIRDRLSKATTPEEKEATLLAIRVLDPACGSGHFLLAAARRLALELARIKAGDDEPSEELRRECLRKVVARCIYGVDKNPMAVELCKVALWIEAIEPGKPLGFLDAHIQCGDSLVGVFDPKVLDEGIADGAYKPLTGDDKKICASLKKKNQDFVVRGQPDLLAYGAMSQAIPSTTAFEDISEEDLQAVRRKEKAYQAWRKDPAIQQELQRADAYTAAFFLPKKEDTQDLVPLSQNLDALKGGASLSPLMANAVAKAAEDFRFLHWPLAFPEVMGVGGFDCVLGNPPWERIKLQEKEFFAARSEAIATAVNKAVREQLIQELQSETASAADRLLANQFYLAKRGQDASIEFAKSGNRFPLTAHGSLNTYALFGELCHCLINPLGRLGVIVPTGIATDDSGCKFISFVASTNRLISLYDFENKNAIFPGVHRSYKFCLFTLGVQNAKAASLCFFAISPSDLTSSQKHFTLNHDQISLVNPESKTIPVLRSSYDAELTLRIYSSNSILKSSSESRDSGWGIVLRRMLHKSMDADKLIHASNAENSYALPVYEGSCGWQYDHRYSSYTDGEYRIASAEWKCDSTHEVSTEYLIKEENFKSILSGWELDGLLKSSAFLGFRRVARSTDERTIVACIMPLPPSTYGWILTLATNDKDISYLLGLYNSLVFDYLARNSLSQPSIPQGMFEQIAVPSRLESNPLREEVEARCIELTYTSYSLSG